MLRQHCSPGFLLVTPGIRPADASKDDQKRTATPSEAMAMGVNYMVIGRPITQAVYPGKTLSEILKSVSFIQ